METTNNTEEMVILATKIIVKYKLKTNPSYVITAAKKATAHMRGEKDIDIQNPILYLGLFLKTSSLVKKYMISNPVRSRGKR